MTKTFEIARLLGGLALIGLAPLAWAGEPDDHPEAEPGEVHTVPSRGCVTCHSRFAAERFPGFAEDESHGH